MAVEIIVGDPSLYGITEDATYDVIRLLARTEGLIANPVYTGKALRGLLGEARPRAAASSAVRSFSCCTSAERPRFTPMRDQFEPFDLRTIPRLRTAESTRVLLASQGRRLAWTVPDA